MTKMQNRRCSRVGVTLLAGRTDGHPRDRLPGGAGRAAGNRRAHHDPEARLLCGGWKGPWRPRHPIAALRSRLRRLPDSREPAPDQPRDVAQRRGDGVAQSLGRRRGLPEHLPAPRLPGLHLGRPARRPRQLGLRGTHLQAGRRPGSGELHLMAVRREVPELVRGRAVSDERPRGLEPGVTGALRRVRHGRERAVAVGRRGEADGQDRSERRAHQFRRRHARHPDGAQDEQPGRYRDV